MGYVSLQEGIKGKHWLTSSDHKTLFLSIYLGWGRLTTAMEKLRYLGTYYNFRPYLEVVFFFTSLFETETTDVWGEDDFGHFDSNIFFKIGLTYLANG